MIKVGDGVTVVVGTDQHGATVERVEARSIWARLDKRTNVGDYHSQEWVHEPNPQGRLEQFTLRRTKHGPKWVASGHSVGDGVYLSLGGRRSYYDPSF